MFFPVWSSLQVCVLLMACWHSTGWFGVTPVVVTADVVCDFLHCISWSRSVLYICLYLSGLSSAGAMSDWTLSGHSSLRISVIILTLSLWFTTDGDPLLLSSVSAFVMLTSRRKQQNPIFLTLSTQPNLCCNRQLRFCGVEWLYLIFEHVEGHVISMCIHTICLRSKIEVGSSLFG